MWSAWPLSWRSSSRFPVPPSAYVAKTHGGRGVHGPTGGWSAAHAPMPSVNATGTGGRPGRGRMSYVSPEVARIRADGGQVVVVDDLEPIGRHERAEPTRRRPRDKPVVPRLDAPRPDDRPPRSQDLVEHPLERPVREPQGDGVRLDRRPVLRPSRRARAQQASVRAGVAAVAVDHAPDRRQRLEQRPTGLRVLLGGQATQHGQPIDRLPAEPDRLGRLAVASVESGPRPGHGRFLVGRAADGRSRARRRLEFVEPRQRRAHVREGSGVFARDAAPAPEPVERPVERTPACPVAPAPAHASTRPPDRSVRRVSAPRRGRRRPRAARRRTARRS